MKFNRLLKKTLMKKLEKTAKSLNDIKTMLFL